MATIHLSMDKVGRAVLHNINTTQEIRVADNSFNCECATTREYTFFICRCRRYTRNEFTVSSWLRLLPRDIFYKHSGACTRAYRRGVGAKGIVTIIQLFVDRRELAYRFTSLNINIFKTHVYRYL